MSSIRYICEGKCKAKITVDDYKSGKKKCGDKTCNHFGSPLIRMEYCSVCNTTFDEGEEHICF